jgi:homoserine O-acetyltransferase
MQVLPWLRAQETSLLNAFDANDWLYQSWAHGGHDIITTPGIQGGTLGASRAIKAKTLALHGTGDLLHPEYEPIETSRYISDVRVVRISPGTVTGHTAAGGGFPADVDFLNHETTQFLEVVTQHGRRLR